MTDAPACVHCRQPIAQDDHGRWLHLGGRGYQCRNAVNALLSTYAAPAGQPRHRRRNERPD